MTQTGFDPHLRHRHSIRLKGYDYSQAGAYFVTIVAYQRACLFGEIVDGDMKLNGCGCIVDESWHAIPEHFPNVELGVYVVMPNHIHGIIVIHEAATVPSPPVGARHASPLQSHGAPPRSLGAIVGSFKSSVTKRIGRELTPMPIWQRNYCEHIVRNEREMDRIWRYIESNPFMWADDDEYPSHGKP